LMPAKAAEAMADAEDLGRIVGDIGDELLKGPQRGAATTASESTCGPGKSLSPQVPHARCEGQHISQSAASCLGRLRMSRRELWWELKGRRAGNLGCLRPKLPDQPVRKKSLNRKRYLKKPSRTPVAPEFASAGFLIGWLKPKLSELGAYFAPDGARTAIIHDRLAHAPTPDKE
jgi:hypothetical protein